MSCVSKVSSSPTRPNTRKLVRSTSELLVVIHPGSACGSADDNIGRGWAEGSRKMMIGDLEKWTGDLIVIDGELSDELEWDQYQSFGGAVKRALQRAKDAGKLAFRAYGDDPDHLPLLKRLMKKSFPAKSTPVRFVGAWHYPDESLWGTEGCVGEAFKTLEKMGYRHLDILNSTMTQRPEDY